MYNRTKITNIINNDTKTFISHKKMNHSMFVNHATPSVITDKSTFMAMSLTTCNISLSTRLQYASLLISKRHR